MTFVTSTPRGGRSILAVANWAAGRGLVHETQLVNDLPLLRVRGRTVAGPYLAKRFIPELPDHYFHA